MQKLNLLAPINTTSYGYHSSYTYKYLCEMGVDVAHISIGRDSPDPRFELKKKLFHHDAPCLKIWHQFDLSGFTGKEKIAFTVFELDNLSKTEMHNMSYPDRLIVATEWAKRVCADHGIEAIKIPLGYDDEVFLPVEPNQQDNTIFANFGKFEIRKGHDVLVQAFNKAFTKDDNVTLVMMPYNQFLTNEQMDTWKKMYLSSPMGEKIQIVPRMNTHNDVYNIMRQVDCGIFPARAEGWNLEALEMLGIGKHIIITNCTGHTEYVNSSNSMLIEMDDDFETAYDGIFFNGEFKWRSFKERQMDQLVEHMRNFHKNRNNLKINSAGVNDASKYSWKNSVSILKEEIFR